MDMCNCEGELSAKTKKEIREDIAEFFDKVDTDNDGILTSDEVMTKFFSDREVFDDYWSHETTETMIRDWITDCDPTHPTSNPDNKITEVEVLAYAIGKEQPYDDSDIPYMKSQIKAFFKAADTNQDGFLSLDEAIDYALKTPGAIKSLEWPSDGESASKTVSSSAGKLVRRILSRKY